MHQAGHTAMVLPKWSYRTDGIITTVVGNGTRTGVIDGEGGDPADDLGDGGPATSASLNSPSGVAVDAAGNLYIADSDNDRVRKVSPDGIITTVAGGGTCCFAGDGGQATGASLWNPGGVTVDSTGNLTVRLAAARPAPPPLSPHRYRHRSRAAGCAAPVRRPGGRPHSPAPGRCPG